MEEALYNSRFDEIHCVMVALKSAVKNTMPRLQMTSFFLYVRWCRRARHSLRVASDISDSSGYCTSRIDASLVKKKEKNKSMCLL